MRNPLRARLLLAVILVACSTPGAPASPTPTAVPPTNSALPSAQATPTHAPVVTPAGPPPGVVGTVTAGPVCPVERNPPDPNCAPRPVAGAVIVATDQSGKEVGRATTKADGTYWLVIDEEGTMLITAQPVAGLMRVPAPVTVTLIGPGDIHHVDLEYDTGIR